MIASEIDSEEYLTQRGLERRLKRHLLKDDAVFLGITTPGFEATLANDLSKIDCLSVKATIDGGVLFSGSLDSVYYANLYCRTANRILLRIETFKARSYPELFQKAKRIKWELYAGFTDEISFSVSSRNSRLHHTDNIAASVFDAIQQKMQALGISIKRTEKTGIRFYIRFSEDECMISVDSSGELLYKRGYRNDIAHAPIRETLAASLLMFSNAGKFPVIADPLCGSGVMLFEALMIVLGRAPGLNRKFAFELWPSFNLSKWNRIRNEAVQIQKKETAVRFIASDIDHLAIEATRKNYRNLDGEYRVPFEISLRDCFDFNRNNEYGSCGLIISNLPYGKRVGEVERLDEFYEKIGRYFTASCKGWSYGFVTASRRFPEISGLKIKNEIKFQNGGIPVYFYSGVF